MWLLKIWKIMVFVFDSIFLRSAGQCSVKLSPGGWWDLGGGGVMQAGNCSSASLSDAD